jgi:hypothetical protein
MTYIRASHHLTELEAELRQAQVSRLLAIERARDAAREPQDTQGEAEPISAQGEGDHSSEASEDPSSTASCTGSGVATGLGDLVGFRDGGCRCRGGLLREAPSNREAPEEDDPVSTDEERAAALLARDRRPGWAPSANPRCLNHTQLAALRRVLAQRDHHLSEQEETRKQ